MLPQYLVYSSECRQNFHSAVSNTSISVTYADNLFARFCRKTCRAYRFASVWAISSMCSHFVTKYHWITPCKRIMVDLFERFYLFIIWKRVPRTSTHALWCDLIRTNVSLYSVKAKAMWATNCRCKLVTVFSVFVAQSSTVQAVNSSAHT